MNRPLDLNLLTVFDAVWRMKNVSKAAEALGLSQPAVSNALRRLRRQLDDPLFVRTAEGMLPTSAAQRLGPALRAALSQIDAGLSQRLAFDPASERRTMTLTVSDIGSIVFLPGLLEHCMRVAPGLEFRTLQLSTMDVTRALQDGEADLALGFMPDLQRGIYQQLLFSTEYVCLVRRDHPTIGERITRKQFLAASHAVAEVAESRGQYVVEGALASLNLRIGLRIPHFLALPMVIARTDMVATVAKPLAMSIRATDNLRLLEHPLRLPRPSIKQFWHERYHKDPANVWLRRTMHQLFADSRPWESQ